MKILLLGHGKYHRQMKSERSICADKDYYENVIHANNVNTIITLDYNPNVEPDVCFDFTSYKYPFQDREFDIIIDASGIELAPSYSKKEFWEEINRLLKLRGYFLGRRRSLFRDELRVDFMDNNREEIDLINRHGLYEKIHPSNQNQNFLSLEKVHRPRYE